MASDTIDQLARRLAESLPQGMRAVRDDLEQNFRAVLQSGLQRLDLVTREEFEVQEAVLARTRGKLEALEERLAALERPAPPGGARKAAGKKARGRKTAKKAAGRKKAGKKSSRKKAPGAGK